LVNTNFIKRWSYFLLDFDLKFMVPNHLLILKNVS
jgi:hypothetical protein